MHNYFFTTHVFYHYASTNARVIPKSARIKKSPSICRKFNKFKCSSFTVDGMTQVFLVVPMKLKALTAMTWIFRHFEKNPLSTTMASLSSKNPSQAALMGPSVVE